MKRLQQQTLKFDKTTKTLQSARKSSTSSDDDTGHHHKTIKSSTATTTTSSSAKPGSFLSLTQSMNDASVRVYKDDKFVIIRDKYPKSKCHLLLIPLQTSDVTKLLKVEDLIRLPQALSLLKEIKELISSKLLTLLPSSINKSHLMYGFHAIQSMQPLHMHIMTRDFQSECFKNKKHWNSFNTSYFIQLDELIKHLEVDLNNLSEDYFVKDKFNLKKTNILNEYLKSDLKCNVCGLVQNNIPNLKKHLLTHM
jgi:aprataxin